MISNVCPETISDDERKAIGVFSERSHLQQRFAVVVSSNDRLLRIVGQFLEFVEHAPRGEDSGSIRRDLNASTEFLQGL